MKPLLDFGFWISDFGRKATRHGALAPIQNPKSKIQNRLGLTLLELMISLVILSIIMLGAQSAVVIASKALPDGRSSSSRVVAASNVMDLLNSELAYATSFSVMNANAVAFTVADRNKDGQPETIRYDWSGTAGAPLTRTYNGGTAVTIAPSVQRFQLVYNKSAKPQAVAYSEGSEILLDSFLSSSSLNDIDVKNDNWPAQIFSPSLPSDAVSWRVTRVVLKVKKKGGANGITKVQLRPVLNGAPTSAVLAETTLLESTLTDSYMWQNIPFSSGGPFGPSASLCVVLEWVADSDACRVQFRNSLLGNPTNYMLKDGGPSSWSATNDSMLYYVYGTVTTPNPATYSYNLTSIGCTFQSTSDAASQLNASVQILNQPQVAGP